MPDSLDNGDADDILPAFRLAASPGSLLKRGSLSCPGDAMYAGSGFHVAASGGGSGNASHDRTGTGVLGQRMQSC
jgi:hypothetical protein